MVSVPVFQVYQWYGYTEVTTLTGVSPVSESIIRRRNSLFGHVTRLAEDTLARLCGATSTWHSVVSRTVAGDVVQDAPGTDGWTSFVVTTPRLLTFGDEPRHVDIPGWRYGPRRLRVNDDDDEWYGYWKNLANWLIFICFYEPPGIKTNVLFVHCVQLSECWYVTTLWTWEVQQSSNILQSQCSSATHSSVF